MKNNKGITLVALIITIIVMLILAGISISMLINEDGVIKKAEEAPKEYQKQAEIEKVLMEIQFNKNTSGEKMKGKTAEELSRLIVENDLDINKLAIFYEPSTKKEYIVYKYDKVETEEERQKFTNCEYELDGQKVNIQKLMGDFNLDGLVNWVDYKLFFDNIGSIGKTLEEFKNEYTGFEVFESIEEVEEYWLAIGDFVKSMELDTSDVLGFQEILHGSLNVYPLEN